MTPLYMYYAPCFVLAEHDMCHEPIIKEYLIDNNGASEHKRIG